MQEFRLHILSWCGLLLQVDPTLTRADRLVGQVLGEVGELPDVFTELEINFFLLRRLLGVRTTVCMWLSCLLQLQVPTLVVRKLLFSMILRAGMASAPARPPAH